MNCNEAQLLVGADPAGTAAALEEHLKGCGACAGFRAEMRALDADIRRALERPPGVLRAAPNVQSPAWRRWALAASVALAAFVALAVWVLRPSDTLASEVVAHVESEPDSWLAKEHVTAAEIERGLREAGVTLGINSDRITYAHSCWFRGHYVPHLVVQTAHGEATVILLRHEHLSARRAFHEAGMSGVIVPAGQGSIAVLARGGTNVDDIAGAMQRDVRWLPGNP